MKNYLPALVALFVFSGCNQSVDTEQAGVETPVIQGELLNSAPAQSTKDGLPESAAPREDPTTAASATGQAAQAAGVGEIPSNLLDSGPAAPDSANGVVAAGTVVTSASGTGKDEGEYKFVAFDTLAGYEYFLTPMNESSLNKEPPKDQIPKHIRDLNGRKVIIEGYMVPIDVEGERIQSFILTNSMMMCCYGAMPWINEWIFVEMENEDGAGFFNDVVIRAKGVLEVGEEIEDGMVISLYRMKGHVVESTGTPIPFLFGK